ncbi:hypothetical protein BJV77DRAFT_1072756 [Russula vinacea]|nr:hypothetical protein BJV77DRAFT_1072756 [Russula vinacea]
MVHDTALIFHHPRRRPLKPGLAWLTRKWLGRTIQDRGPGGHDPEEDARACVDLLKAKIKMGQVGRAGPGLGTGRRMPTRCPSLVHSCPTPSLALTSHSTLLHTCLTTPLNADILDSALAFAYTPPLTSLTSPLPSTPTLMPTLPTPLDTRANALVLVTKR